MDRDAQTAALIRGAAVLMTDIHKNSLHKEFSGEAIVLVCIALCEGHILPGELASRLKVSQARVAAVLGVLERKGLIRREVDATDRRRMLVTITEDGSAACDSHLSMLRAKAGKVLDALGDEDAGNLVRIVGRLHEIFDKNEKKGKEV
ncbi:MAG: MarR family transcriptional regulator [Oscillospiraceae bacterium]|jgi:DNA-binding MarR family transcriptional regulator|nr:MarR family transcriptional regulator [Oscillospiraceae bacterium]